MTVGIPYTLETDEKLVNETFGPNNIRRRRTGTHELKQMTVQNGRRFADQLSLEEQGFVLVEHRTKVADFFDAAQLESVYYPEVEELIKKTSGASRVVIFDHTLRSGDETEREAKLIREPVLSAHNDYTEWSGPQRVREALPDEAEKLLARRFAIIQVWRAINQPIQANPLAVADAGSIFLRCGATKPWCSKFMIPKRMAGRVSRLTHHSSTRLLLRTLRRVRASRYVLSHSSRHRCLSDSSRFVTNADHSCSQPAAIFHAEYAPFSRPSPPSRPIFLRR